MPRFQKLYERYKNRPDVLLLTLSMDENPGLIEPFVKEHKFTFPVLPAFSFVEDTLHVLGIPQNWIVDANGVVRQKEIGFEASDNWENWMAEAIEKNKPETTTAAARPPGL